MVNEKKALTTAALFIGLVVLLSVAGDPAAAQRPRMSDPEIRWQVEEKALLAERTLLTYRAVEKEALDLEGAMGMVERLSATAGIDFAAKETLEQEGRRIFTSREDPTAVFDLESSTGAFLFHAGWARYSGEGSTPGLPPAEKAPDVARRYLAELDLLPAKEAELVVDRVGGVGMSAARDGRTTGTFEKLVTVYFRREIDGVPVRGRGSRILVHLGEEGALAGLIRNWPEVRGERVSQGEVREEGRLREEIRYRLLRLAGGSDLIEVRKTELVLFDDGRGVLEPAIYVVADAHYPGPEGAETAAVIPVDFYVPAVTEAVAYYPYLQDEESSWPASDTDVERGRAKP